MRRSSPDQSARDPAPPPRALRVAADPGQPQPEAAPTPAPSLPVEIQALREHLRAQRAWAMEIELADAVGVVHEVHMLRQAMRDAFVTHADDTARAHAAELRRLLREQALVPEIGDPTGEHGLEDSLSADLRRVLGRVGLEMGVDA